jgi:2-phosphoglycerate kinase
MMTMIDSNHSLDHVYWLGGSPCAGKSSISKILAAHFDLSLYQVDDALEDQMQRLDPTLHPVLTDWLAATWNERWMKPVAELVQEAIAAYSEHFTLILQDILALPDHKPLLVEGTALLPRLVASVARNRNHMIWLVPTDDFQRTHYAGRDWIQHVLAECDDPEAAFVNWMERDSLFARWITAEASALGLALLEVDGTQSVEDNASEVASHFQLSALPSRF